MHRFLEGHRSGVWMIWKLTMKLSHPIEHVRNYGFNVPISEVSDMGHARALLGFPGDRLAGETEDWRVTYLLCGCSGFHKLQSGALRHASYVCL